MAQRGQSSDSQPGRLRMSITRPQGNNNDDLQQMGSRPQTAPIRNVSFGGGGDQTQQQLHNNRQFRDAQASYEEQIQALETDKVSLMKRLNMVLSELESATHEKAAIGLRVADQERQSEELKRKLEEAASLKQAVNRNMQDELRYERELNEKMREEITRFEQEKEAILARLKDSEGLSQDIQRETNAIKSSLVKKTEEVKRLEREHESNLERLRELTNQLENLRGQEMHGKGEKRRLEEELEEISREKENLLRRMSDLSQRYEDYCAQMDRERADIQRANRNHIKLLTAKLFYQILSDMAKVRRKESFQAMQSCSTQLKKVETIVQRFVRVLQVNHTEGKRHFLREWYRLSMNFTHEHYKKLNLIDFKVAKKSKIVFFYNWRNAYQRRQQVHESKMHSVSRLSKLFKGRQDLILRNKLCVWRDFVELRQYQQESLGQVLQRHCRRDQRTALVMWIAQVKAEQFSKRYENMTSLITTLNFKQRIFLSLKHACLVSRTQRQTSKFQEWKLKCQERRDRGYYLRKKLMIERLQGVRSERLVKQCFDAIKYFILLEKYEATRDRLGQEIPIREDLERKRDTLIKNNRTKDKYNALRKCCIRHADAKHRALQVWKENVVYFNRTMNRMKLRLIELHRGNLSVAFVKWREGTDRKTMVQLLENTEDLINENQELKNTLNQCYEKQESLEESKQRQRALKVQRLLNNINRHQMWKMLSTWAQNTWYISCIDQALTLSQKTLNSHKLKSGFARYVQKVKEVKREEHALKRVQWQEKVRERKRMDMCLDAWKTYVRRFKKSKVFLIRSINGVDRLITNDAFTTWKATLFQSRRTAITSSISDLHHRQHAHELQISDLNRQLQVNDSTLHHLDSKLHSQSHKILANFISRFIHSSLSRGFFTWVDALKEFKTRRRFLRSVVNYWTKQNQGRAFRKWAEHMLSEKERELAGELGAREAERKELQRVKDEEETAQGREIDNLTNELQTAIQVKEQLRSNYHKALQTHINRVHNNVYVDRRRNIFCIWAAYIKKEKNAVNVIGAIARKQLRMEVFSRIRLVARERFLEGNAERIIGNFFSMFKQHMITRSFSKWRLVSHSDAVKEMTLRQDELALTKSKNQLECQVMEAHNQQKAISILTKKRQREVTYQWMTMAKQMKNIRVKSETLQENIKYLQIQRSLSKWHRRVTLTNYLRRRNTQVLTKYRQQTLQKCYLQWHLRTSIAKALCQKIMKFGRRMQAMTLTEGFCQIVHFAKSFKERDRERKQHAVHSAGKIIARMLKKRLCESFHSLRFRGHKKEFKVQHLRRMLKHVLAARMKHFFGKWRQQSDLEKLAQNVNTEGDVVLERNEMRRNVKALKDFLKTQGYNEEDVQEFLEKKNQQQKSQMHRAIVGLFFRKSDFEIIPKAFNQWKKWLQQRKLMKQWSRYCVNAMNHPLHWAFKRWKHQEEEAKERLKHVLKKDLVKKIIDDEMAIGSAQHRIERMDENIENLAIQRDSLLQHYIAGQRLALALGHNNQLRSMFRAFVRWKRETRDYEQHLLLQQLERTNIMITDLMQHVSRLESIHTNLLGENEELRQAAMDGVEIAKAVQDLTREREELSQDLQERASTIKRLIEDNNTLAFRLSVAQKEAEQLEELNREVVTGSIAERDMNRQQYY